MGLDMERARGSGPKDTVVGKQREALAARHRVFRRIQRPGSLQPPLQVDLRQQPEGLQSRSFRASGRIAVHPNPNGRYAANLRNSDTAAMVSGNFSTCGI